MHVVSFSEGELVKRTCSPFHFGGCLKEVEIQKQILAVLKNLRIKAWRSNNIAVKGRKFIGLKGVPDILGVLPPHGTMLAIEVKTEKGIQSDEQREFQAMCVENGAVYILARSIQDVIDVVMKL